jgi:two-component system cell cycle response regulator CpdR
MNPKRILVVDDDLHALGFLEAGLGRAGYQVVACATYEDAREFLAAHKPDLLLTDVRLGVYNGLQLALFATLRYPGVPIIVLTGYDDPTMRAESQKVGAAFLVKPVHIRELLAQVGTALES